MCQKEGLTDHVPGKRPPEIEGVESTIRFRLSEELGNNFKT